MLTTAIIVLGAGLITEFVVMLNAPLGYQDETGFHIGAKSADTKQDGAA